MGEPFKEIELSSLRRLSGTLQHLVETQLWIKVLIGLFLGIIAGFILGPTVGIVDSQVSATIVSWLALPGTIFIALIQMIVVPLVFASIVRGLTATESSSELKVIGISAGIFFLITTAIATFLGLALTLLIKPGRLVSAGLIKTVTNSDEKITPTLTEVSSFTDLPQIVTSLLPSNPLASMVGGEMVQVIFFAVIVGIALVNLATEKSAPLFDLLGSIQEVCMKIVSWAMLIAPFAVFGLIARLTSSVGVEILKVLSFYVLTVTLGLFLMMVIFLALVFLLAQKNPIEFLKSVKDVVLLSLSTSSSAAVMPLSIKTAEDSIGVKPSIARFLIPLGATVNMNGTALYQGVATIFLAQVFDVQIGTFGLLFVVTMAVAASIGSPATPGTGIIILATILEGVGIPTAGIALIIGVDRILDMMRTSVNVTGDLTACVVIDRLYRTQAITYQQDDYSAFAAPR
ncbi:MAG: cation:dicarboxylase symporter family transporter [Candidatus Dadabacteria bacterium]|nr:cation:dicarboxylase symporter family transporter [Candidatus Dadabacteria bacterium]NIT13347.1 cation:dicarboxylase symporter family transporter [Candidatus Dadabacteria bacterium]